MARIIASASSGGRSEMDQQLGWFHTCSSWQLRDLKIKYSDSPTEFFIIFFKQKLASFETMPVFVQMQK